MKDDKQSAVDLAAVLREMHEAAERVLRRIDVAVENGSMSPEIAKRLKQAIKEAERF